MIIGKGLLAKAFEEYSDNNNIIIFASGVSNSKEERAKEFNREKKLLINTLKNSNNKAFIYFSTCSIYDTTLKNSAYVIHKQEMESIVQNTALNYYIFRLPQVVGKSKSPTLINYLFNSINNNIKMRILSSAYRNLIYIDDVFSISKIIIENNIFKNKIINIASPYSEYIISIINMIEDIIQRKAIYKLIEGGSNISIDINEIQSLDNYTEIFTQNYTYNILLKYYNEDYLNE